MVIMEFIKHIYNPLLFLEVRIFRFKIFSVINESKIKYNVVKIMKNAIDRTISAECVAPE